MSAEFLPPLQAIEAPQSTPWPSLDIGSRTNEASGATFGHLVSQGLQQVTNQLQTSQVDLQHLAAGDIDNLHQVMIRLEQSRLSFQLMVQVRNRLLESYQEVMRMQV